MTAAISSRRRVLNKRLGDKAVIQHLVRAMTDNAKKAPRVHAPFTRSGLSVEEQVRKVWRPNLGGLALF